MKQPEKKDMGGDIGTAVHQLRTPLTSIKWVLGLLQKGDNGPINGEQKELIMKTLEKVEYMSSVITDILRTYQMEEGKVILNLKKENIEEIIEAEIKELTIFAESKNINIIFKKLNKNCPLLNIDRSKMELVINNLLSNAIKYSPVGKNVEIKTEIEDFELKVSFTDSGIGIPDEQQPKIFSKFFRADNAIQLQSEGTGLGLFISKNIMEAHKGDIWFDSHKDKGSTFYITIPIK